MTRSGSATTSKRHATTGTVLLSALALTAVLLIIFLAVLTYCLSRYGQHIRENNRLTAHFLADAGIQELLAKVSKDSLFRPEATETALNGGTIHTKTLAWGPFLLAISDGNFANQTVRSTALLGSTPPPCFSGAITVSDPNYPLVVAGNTLINGDVYTGPLGMTTGRIRGEGVVNENYHTGQVITSPVPPHVQLDSSVMLRYVAEQGKRRTSAAQTFSGTQVWRTPPATVGKSDWSCRIENNLVLDNCRLEVGGNLMSLFVNGSVEITGRSTVTGLVEIVAGGPIYVSDSTVVDEALLYSPDSIVMQKSAQFSGLALSSRRVCIKDRASMRYPAVFDVQHSDQEHSDSCGIWLQSRGTLEGLCYLASGADLKTARRYALYQDTGTTFTGFLVSEGRSDVRGTILGSILTHQFVYSEPATEYVNWVKDLKVDRTRLKFKPMLPMLSGPDSTQSSAIVRQEFDK